MGVLYSIICFAFIMYSKSKYRRLINPQSVFLIPWAIVVLGYELKFVEYYSLTFFSYFVIIMSTILFVGGATIGSRSIPIRGNGVTPVISISEIEMKKKIRKAILLCSVLGGIATLSSIIAIISRYGTSFIYKVTDIYSDRLLGEFSTGEIPYIGSFLYVAVLLVAIYFVDYGFHPIMIPTILLICLKPFTGGTRQGLVSCIVLLAIPFLLARKGQIKISKKTKTMIIIACTLLVGLLLFVSNQRSNYAVNTSYNNYASPFFLAICKKVPGLYQMYTYFTAPIGVLNEYLKECRFSFGQHTLLPVYNLLNKFGLGIPVQRYQDFYLVPLHINVGTAIRELVEDYTLGPAMLLISLCGLYVGICYRRCENNPTLVNRYNISFMYFLVLMSWFVWFLRDANLVIALIAGRLITKRLSKYLVHKDSFNNKDI